MALVASDQAAHLLDQVKRRAWQTLHLKRITIEGFKPFALGEDHRAVDRRESYLVDMHLGQQFTFQIQTFGK
ncbi:hypothetical protein D3C75_1184880 [compost metagenome]